MEKSPLPPKDLVSQRNVTIASETFETIYNRYVGKVYQKCYSMTKDPEVAKDFTQDIFIKVYSKMDTFQNRSAFLTWLYSISHNYCLDQLRLNKRFNPESLPETYTHEFIEPEQTDPILAKWYSVESIMRNMAPEEVDILRLKYEHGMPIKLIGEQYQISESAVKMRLKRSREKISRLYSQRHPM